MKKPEFKQKDKEFKLFEHPIKRRDFMSISGSLALGFMISGCAVAQRPKLTKVSIAQADSYDRRLIRQKIEEMFNQLDGISDIIKPGDRVAIKVNLTGGIVRQGELPYSPIESFQTHPEVVRAVGELVKDAGAKEIVIVEGIFDDISYSATGYNEIAKPLAAELIDLNNPYPYNDFMEKEVGEGWQIYERFIFNRLLDEVDVFISIPKMKCHQVCGITLSLKNSIGLAPLQYYDDPDTPRGHRAGMHGKSGETRTRLAKVITDLNIARPIDLAIIDGIHTSEGGEGPWIRSTFNLIEANLLIAGKDPVAADAVATAAMDFDPDAPDFETPFNNCENHLAMAHEYKLGTNQLNEIEIVGAELEDVACPFKPCL
ncbi:DUF362 domain-containing protein [bacterium]|nr:DUF362 domain-containing protein [bacterium]